MTRLNKRAVTYQEALEGLTGNMTLLAGGFGLCGISENLITEVRRREVQGPTVVSSNCDADGFGLDILLGTHQMRKVIASYMGGNALFKRQMLSSELEAILMPQDALAERSRVGGAGTSAFFTVTGYGTPVVKDKKVREFIGRPYILEQAITGDFASAKGWEAGRYDSVIYRHIAQNLSPLMAAAGRITVMEVEEIIPPGKLDPTAIHTPEIFINRIIQRQSEKRIKQRALCQRGA